MTQETRDQGQEVGGMSRRAASRLAWSVCAVILLILALSLVLIVLGWSTPLPQDWTPWRDQAVSLVGVIGAPILGGLVASRRPHNPYGWLWLGFGLGLALQQLAEPYAAYALVVEPGSLVAPRTISHVLGLGGPVALTCAPFLLMLFPTGQLPSRRWRPLAWITLISGTVLLALNLFFPRPDEVGGAVTTATVAAVLALFASIVLSALSLVVRYRKTSGMERQQLKWFALAAGLSGLSIVGQVLTFFVAQVLNLDPQFGDTLWNLLGTATNTGLYMAVGFAILRYRLYEIDILINRTLVYGFLTATLALVYFGVWPPPRLSSAPSPARSSSPNWL